MPNAVIFCSPVYGTVPGTAHAAQMEFVTVSTARGLLQGIIFQVNAYIDVARNELISRVLDDCPQATHVFFADQDMMLPLGTIEGLLANDADVVTGTYFGKDKEATLVGWESLEPRKRLENFDPNGLTKVAGFGAGCLLIKTDLLRRMEEKYQDRWWFKCPGEDAHFSQRLQEMNVPFYLDGRVQCGHQSEYAVTVDHWKAAKEKS